MSWCELASWRGSLVLLRCGDGSRAVFVRPDGVFEMFMVYGSVQMFLTRWSAHVTHVE
jgi:hypothetical protein